MGNNKFSRIFGPVLGIMAFMLTIGVVETPVFAVDNVQANSSYTDSTTATENKDYFININKSATQNGFKVTVDKAVATKNKLKVILKVESEKPFDKMKQDNSNFKIIYGGNIYSPAPYFHDYLADYVDDKTMIVALEFDNYKGGYPEKGELKVIAEFPDYKVNIEINTSVDFTEALKNTIVRDLSVKIPNSNYTINKLESNVLGTRIVYSKLLKGYPFKDNFGYSSGSSMILKIGDKMYQFKCEGIPFSLDDGMIFMKFNAEVATYDRVKNENNISIIPVECDMPWDDIVKLYDASDKNGYTEKRNANKEIINNVRYARTFELSNGSTGKIYNVERNDNSIKVYCKGNSEKESLLLASSMYMYYIVGDGKKGFNNGLYARFYKDSKDTLGYVVEFCNVEKDKLVDVDFVYLTKEIDKFKIGDEIQISK